MLLVGILTLLLGAGLLGTLAWLAATLARRARLPRALLLVGIITATGARIVQIALIQGAAGPLLTILPIRALALGLSAGVIQEVARALGYGFLARGAVTKPQAALIGLGHGLVEPAYAGLLLLALGLSLVGGGAEQPDDPAGLLSGALADALASLLPIVMHMALSWVVLQVFLRGEIGWLFAAIFAHSLVELGAASLAGAGTSWPLVAWRAVVALASVVMLARLRAPGATSDA